MAVGYTPDWWPWLTAIGHVQWVTSAAIDAAVEALVLPLREGKIKSRYRGQPVRVIGGQGGVAPEQWYHATTFSDGTVKFGPDPRFPHLGAPHGLGEQRSEIEVWRADVLRWWPEPTDSPGAGEDVAVVTPEPRAAGVTEARIDDASRNTVSYTHLKAAIEKHGSAAEGRLIVYAKKTFSDKHVPRELVRRARHELFGKPNRGRPKITD
jgi:hypothetical protein